MPPTPSTAMPGHAAPVPPWYRQRWPWLLIAGPLIVVVAGFVTAYIAWSTDDGVIAEDYYKRGLLINESLERGARGAELGLGAIVRVGGDGAVRVDLTAPEGFARPGAITLRLVHATRAGLDRSAVLAPDPQGAYGGHVEPPPAGRWRVSIETESWRLPAAEVAGRPDEVRLGTEREAR
jgi:hypothetical protein